jgi:hypothetical protein
VQEHYACGETRGQLDLRVLGQRTQEFLGFLQQQAAAVAGLAVGGDGAAVRQAVQRGNGGLHQPMAGFIVETGDQAEAAAVALEGLAV